MPLQSYANHRRFYPLHHFVFLPLWAALLTVCAVCARRYEADRTVWIVLTAAVALLGFAGIMMRQHYALGNQNRIVRLEMRLRYYQLTGQRLEPLEEKLGFGRIAALRFASDKELPALVARALAENLSADAIKRSIMDWQADAMRV